MNKLKLIEIIGLIIALPSVILVNISLNKIWVGNTMYWVEPNKFISTVELILSYIGIVIIVIMIYNRLKGGE